ncbi:MAG: hypothetical protein ACRDHM_00300 [Actinomycetota bacterium]
MVSARATGFVAKFAIVATLTLSPLSAAPAGAAAHTGTHEAHIVVTSSSGAERLCNVTHPVADEAPPFGVGPCPGVRPGAAVWSDGGGCTLNFMFTGYRQDGLGGLVEDARFMGTAGHCIVDQSEQVHVWQPGQGPEARDGNDVRIGEFAYAVNSSTKDFSLIRLDPGVNANPQMCHFGGPTGLNDPNFTGSPGVIQHFGQGLILGQTVSARSGVGHLSDPNWQFATTAAIFGDSGSGVETEDGRAMGVLVAISPIGIVITRLAPQIEPARQALGLQSLELQTAPELP